MRFRISLVTLFFTIGIFALPLFAHAGIPFFGPIVPAAYNVCPPSWGMLIDVINNIISLLITLAIVFVAPLMIAYSGFLFVVNPFDSGGISKAKGILTNTIVGIVIALAGWMIVDAIMAVLYNPNASSGQTTLGTWSDLITSGGIGPCIKLAGSLSQAPYVPGAISTGVTGVSATGALNPPPLASAGPACDPSAVMAAAAAGYPSYTLTTTQANIFACLAGPESTCGTKNLNFNWGKGVPGSPGSTAAGAFQVLLQSHADCYENRSCYSAAQSASKSIQGGKLNCASGFSNGNPRTDSTGAAIAETCVAAAADLNCSTAAAACLLKQNGGSFSAWQKDAKSSKQTQCINSGGTSGG